MTFPHIFSDEPKRDKNISQIGVFRAAVKHFSLNPKNKDSNLTFVSEQHEKNSTLTQNNQKKQHLTFVNLY